MKNGPIESCGDCANHECNHYRTIEDSYYCKLTGNRLRLPFSEIDEECPLEDYKE